MGIEYTRSEIIFVEDIWDRLCKLTRKHEPQDGMTKLLEAYNYRFRLQDKRPTNTKILLLRMFLTGYKARLSEIYVSEIDFIGMSTLSAYLRYICHNNDKRELNKLLKLIKVAVDMHEAKFEKMLEAI